MLCCRFDRYHIYVSSVSHSHVFANNMSVPLLLCCSQAMHSVLTPCSVDYISRALFFHVFFLYPSVSVSGFLFALSFASLLLFCLSSFSCMDLSYCTLPHLVIVVPPPCVLSLASHLTQALSFFSLSLRLYNLFHSPISPPLIRLFLLHLFRGLVTQ